VERDVRHAARVIVTTVRAVRVLRESVASARHRVTVHAVRITVRVATRVRPAVRVTVTHARRVEKAIVTTAGRAPALRVGLARVGLRVVTAIRVRLAEKAASVRHRVTVRAVPLETVRQGAAVAASAMGVRVGVPVRAATVPPGAKGVVRLPAVMGIAATVRRVRPANARMRNN
jgi:hypothetical protein